MPKKTRLLVLQMIGLLDIDSKDNYESVKYLIENSKALQFMQLRDGYINLNTLAGQVFKNDYLLEIGKMKKPAKEVHAEPVEKKNEERKQNALSSRY